MWPPHFSASTPLTAALCFTHPNFGFLLCFSWSQLITLTTSPYSLASHATLDLMLVKDSPSSSLWVLHLLYSYSFPSTKRLKTSLPFLLSPCPPASTPLPWLPHSYIYNYLSVLTPTPISPPQQLPAPRYRHPLLSSGSTWLALSTTKKNQTVTAAVRMLGEKKKLVIQNRLSPSLVYDAAALPCLLRSRHKSSFTTGSIPNI